MLWGSTAKSFKEKIVNVHTFKPEHEANGINSDLAKRANVVLEGYHPAAEVYKDKPGANPDTIKFVGCKHFIYYNIIAAAKGYPQITW